MKKRLFELTLLAALALPFPATIAQEAPAEGEVSRCLCKGFAQEVRLKSGAVADCLSDTHAIEVDATFRWAEALGQALHFSSETGLRPMVKLYCAKGRGDCLAHILRLKSTIAHHKLDVTVDAFDAADLKDQCGIGELR